MRSPLPLWVSLACAAAMKTRHIVRLAQTIEPLEKYSASKDGAHPSRQGVFEVLSAHAHLQQARVRGILESQKGIEFESLWIDNALVVENAGVKLLRKLESLEEVAEVRQEISVQLPELDLPSPSDVVISAGSEPQKNIASLNTASLWDAGVTGSGVVVATIDSGVRWTHEALKHNYRGAQGGGPVNHDYAFWTADAVPLTPDTVDIYGHGTHVTGTLAGSGPHNIGMAPNATWIHAKVFNWAGVSKEADLLKAAQWVLCPTKYDLAHSAPDCSKGAHVVSCSFGGNASMTWLNSAVHAMRAAGVYPVFAAGNVDAFKCGSVLEPAGGPDAIAVGGVNDGVLYPSSGKGPGLDNSTIKPDFVAPSFSINSALSAADSGHEAYTRLTGTSMATPHVAGALALLLSAQANANNSTELVAILRNTAVQDQKKPRLAASTCGGISSSTYPNDIYGWGLPDVCKAAKAMQVPGLELAC